MKINLIPGEEVLLGLHGEVWCTCWVNSHYAHYGQIMFMLCKNEPICGFTQVSYLIYKSEGQKCFSIVIVEDEQKLNYLKDSLRFFFFFDSLQFSAFFGVCCFRPITWETSLTLIYNKIGLNSPSCSFLLLIAVLVTWMYWFLCQPLFLSQFLSCKLASLNAVPSVYFTKYIGMTLQFDLYILRLRNQAISGPKAIFCASILPH